MKINKNNLKNIIKEEYQAMVAEIDAVEEIERIPRPSDHQQKELQRRQIVKLEKKVASLGNQVRVLASTVQGLVKDRDRSEEASLSKPADQPSKLNNDPLANL